MSFPRLTICILPLLLFGTLAFAAKSADRTQFGRDIHVRAGEETGDVTCFNCSIYFSGHAAGDVTAIHGNITVESGSEIAGDATAILGNITAQSGTQIAGDLTAVAGAVRRQDQVKVAGDVTSLEGTKWMLAIILPPLIFFGGIVALIIWLVQRDRGARAPAYAPSAVQPSSRQ